MARDNGEEMRIGEVLKRARARQGIEIAAIEERTKIRTKYLRALESEEWDVLPSPAYAKGFLRTYAQALGLDDEAIVDEFRRQVETEREPGPFGRPEPVLEGRRRRPADRGGRGPRLGLLIVLGVLVAIAALLVIGLVGGDDDEGPRERPRAGQERTEQKQKQKRERRERGRAGGEEQAAQDETVTLGLTLESDVQICLLSGSNEVLVGQVLSAGSQEQFERERFELRFPAGYDRGQFELTLDGERARLPELSGPAAFAIEPGSRPRQLDPPGLECP
jgi:cytoskeleton protein RodZ